MGSMACWDLRIKFASQNQVMQVMQVMCLLHLFTVILDMSQDFKSRSRPGLPTSSFCRQSDYVESSVRQETRFKRSNMEQLQFVLFAEIALLYIVWLFVSKVGAQTDLGESLWSSPSLSAEHELDFFSLQTWNVLQSDMWKIFLKAFATWFLLVLLQPFSPGWCGREKTARAAELRAPCMALSRRCHALENISAFRRKPSTLLWSVCTVWVQCEYSVSTVWVQWTCLDILTV